MQGQVKRCKRLLVGGKVLTNALKEQISFRQYNMMEETHLMDAIKRACCFVSLDFAGDMDRAKQRTLRRVYVLPDTSAGTQGYLLTDDTPALGPDAQVLELGVELFTVPELLFTPSDAGIEQSGVVDGIMETLADLPDEVIALALENIVLVGGSVQFPGFKERFEHDLRVIAPDEFTVRVTLPENPITFASRCGLSISKDMENLQVTREEYLSSNKRAATKFNQIMNGQALLNNEQGSPVSTVPRRRETIYDETSDRSDTPRSYSPDTEPEDQVMTDAQETKE